MGKLTTEEFIEKAKHIHGDKYDYSKVNMKIISNYEQEKVCIICPEHGEFWQTPYNHLSNHGCQKCAIEYIHKRQKLTTDQFIEKAKEVHGNKYDYSKVEYINNHTKVCIICPEHGEFWQGPDMHLKGRGCPECGGKMRLTTEEFIKRAREVHGNKYDYSKVNFINNKTKVCIICPEHGEFYMKPENHTLGRQNCPKCSSIEKKIKRSHTTNYFIKRAREVHGDKYDYSKVNYINCKTKVCIICPEHGEFWQIPSAHLKGQGCPKCDKSFKLTTEEFIKRAKKVHCNKYDYSKVEYKDSHTKVCIICPEHGEFWQSPTNHLNGNACPLCPEIKNKTEKKVLKILKENFLSEQIEYQKKLNCLKLQSFDFYFSDYNIAIECQGLQHFKPINFFGGDESFKKSVERDIRKFKISEKNNIILLYYIPFKISKKEITKIDIYKKNYYYRIERLINRIKKEIKKQEKKNKKKTKNN